MLAGGGVAGIDHAAHFGGVLAGESYVFYPRKSLCSLSSFAHVFLYARELFCSFSLLRHLPFLSPYGSCCG